MGSKAPLFSDASESQLDRLRAVPPPAGQHVELTGVAQVHAPRDLPRNGKFRYDLLYTRRAGFCLDRNGRLSLERTIPGGLVAAELSRVYRRFAEAAVSWSGLVRSQSIDQPVTYREGRTARQVSSEDLVRAQVDRTLVRTALQRESRNDINPLYLFAWFS